MKPMLCNVSMSFDTAKITAATLTLTFSVVCVFMARSLKNADTSALSDYVNNVIALWWLLGQMRVEPSLILRPGLTNWPPNGELANPPGINLWGNALLG